MKLWLDDVRDPRKYAGWEGAVWVTTPEETIEYLETNLVTHLSLDNDLGLHDDALGPRDGYRVAKWLEERVATDPDFIPPDVLNAHTANPVSRPKMEAAFRKIRHLVKTR